MKYKEFVGKKRLNAIVRVGQKIYIQLHLDSVFAFELFTFHFLLSSIRILTVTVQLSLQIRQRMTFAHVFTLHAAD